MSFTFTQQNTRTKRLNRKFNKKVTRGPKWYDFIENFAGKINRRFEEGLFKIK